MSARTRLSLTIAACVSPAAAYGLTREACLSPAALDWLTPASCGSPCTTCVSSGVAYLSAYTTHGLTSTADGRVRTASLSPGAVDACTMVALRVTNARDMAGTPAHIPIPQLLWRLQTTLHLTQKELGKLVGLSSRTIIRYYQRGGLFLPSQWATLARVLQPHDAALAAYCTRMAGGTIEQLVAGKVPPLPAPASPSLVAPSPAPAAPPAARPAPSANHLADSVVCAGAEAMQCTPTQMRPGLLAALGRMVALGMGAQEALDAMSPPQKDEKAAKSAKK